MIANGHPGVSPLKRRACLGAATGAAAGVALPARPPLAQPAVARHRA